jgi:hypothetical protein
MSDHQFLKYFAPWRQLPVHVDVRARTQAYMKPMEEVSNYSGPRFNNPWHLLRVT